MSRFLLSEDRSCFCCEPALPPGVYSQEMLNQQLQGWDAASSSGSSTEPFAVHALTVPTNDAELSNYPQDNSLSRQHTSQHGWSTLPGNEMSNINQEVEMCQGQESSRIFPPVSHAAVDKDQRGLDPSWNFHVLRNRELGSHMARVDGSESRDSHSNPDFGESEEYSGGMFDGACGKTAANVNNISQTIDMYLDGALNELGMLSTVTNSRRQYLLETQGRASHSKSLQRLHSKSKSSPNLTDLGQPNGYRILHLNKNFVTSLTDTLPFPRVSSTNVFDASPQKSEFSQLECPYLKEASSSHRSDPHFLWKHRYRYTHRQSKSPYNVPRRVRNSLPEPDLISEYFSSGEISLKMSALSTSTPSLEPSTSAHAAELTNCQQSSKSNAASPVKPNVEMRLTRSLSAEDLTSVNRRLEQEMNNKRRERSSTEQNLDIMTSQMTDLHMS